MNKINWESLLAIQENYYDDNGDKNALRSPFQKDRDKVVFSDEFRRMAGKTQVFPTHDSGAPIHFTPHNRLTHSIEVETVGRSLGYIFASEINKAYQKPGLLRTDILDPYEIANIVQASCLAHDLGNPPIGHDGEDIIRTLVAKHKNHLSELSEEKLNDLLYFDGNALSFKIMANTTKYKISYPTLASLVKYPWTSSEVPDSKKAKFSVFSTEKDYFKKIFTTLGLYRDDTFYRHPLSYLMELADDICYAVIDLEDGVAMKKINPEKIQHIFAKFINEKPDQKLPTLRAKVINKSIYEGVSAIIRHTSHYTNEKLDSILDSSSLGSFLKEAKNLARNEIYNEDFKNHRQSSPLGSKLSTLVEEIILETKKTADEKYDKILELAKRTDEEVIKFNQN